MNGKNYFLVDACFLANRYIPRLKAPPGRERDRIDSCLKWWKEIDDQLKTKNARVFVPDICIAETFKVLAKKYYSEKWFKTAVELNNARNRVRKDITTTAKKLRAFNRVIQFHDVPTSRDIVISVDRFYELFLKLKKNVSLPDLILLATGKYLMDFYDIPRDHLHIVTLDKRLRDGSKKLQELPNAYDPAEAFDSVAKVFR
jgi:predicted nucleic acid-binding protein